MWLSSLGTELLWDPPCSVAGLESLLLLLDREACEHTLKEEEIGSFLPADLPPLAAPAPWHRS